jgi:trans-aconitate 2-methyltransferase
MWDPEQYEKYRDERARPFQDLLARVPPGAPATLADLGCGTGEGTATLARRWPSARIWGVDSSLEMLRAAQPRAVPGRVEFVQADVLEWSPPEPLELILSNALFQWIPDQERLLSRVVSLLAPRGVLAVQIPATQGEAWRERIARIASRGPWAPRLQAAPEPRTLSLGRYLELLLRQGFEVDGWETTYHHVLRGPDPVLEWVKGTALRPILTLLPGPEREGFLEECRRELRALYPELDRGTIFAFRRIFFIARRGERSLAPPPGEAFDIGGNSGPLGAQ